MELSVGIASTDITPQRPCRMGGYNRSEPSDGVLDPIKLYALAAQVGDVPLILIVIDSIMVSEEFARAVQAGVTTRLDVPAENITICAIHTHSAPAFFKLAFENVPAEDELTSALLGRAVDTAAEAWRGGGTRHVLG